MNKKQYEIMANRPGFIAALDQSGGSTPKALLAYGVTADMYNGEAEMFDKVHEMRTRIITSPSFTSERILAAILFEQTMDRKIDGMYTADYLWEEKGIIPILKIDKGLMDEMNNVKLMKPIPGLDETLDHAVYDRHIFGTKERSVIYDYNEVGIKAIIDQQFDIGLQVAAHGLVPILEPEVDIKNPHKAESERFMLEEIKKHLAELPEDTKLMFKVTIPTEPDLYRELMDDPRVVRVVALSGGYTVEHANELLAQNHGLIASFSRALAETLRYQQTDEEFNAALDAATASIFEASIK